MGRRSRKRREGESPEPTTAPPRRAAKGPAPSPARRPTSAERDEAARAALRPITPGDRPRALTAAAIVAALLALSNLVLVAVGYEVRDGAGGPGGAIVFAVILFATAWGMWRARYWAVLGFQALLALTALFGFLSLAVAGSIWAGLLSATVVGGAGYLFYKLIRVMARIQLPDRPGASRLD